MFEFAQVEHGLHPGGGLAPEGDYAPVRDVRAASLMIWSEHCIECAAPACYASCDLFRPRPDGRCRRFRQGIVKNRRFRSFRGHAAEVAFERWGRLKTNGSTVVVPLRRLLWTERLLRAGAWLWRALGSPGKAGKDGLPGFTPSRLIDRMARRAQRSAQPKMVPDSFLVEVWNPAATPVRLQVRMENGADLCAPGERLPPPCVRALTLPSGYSRHEIEPAAYAAVVTSTVPFRITVAPDGDAQPTLAFLALDFVMHDATCAAVAARPAQAVGTSSVPVAKPLNEPVAARTSGPVSGPVKCVVFDLDGTLWPGVLSEGDDPALADWVRPALARLDAAGILLSIASRNDAEPARGALAAAGIDSLFVHPQFDWGRKSAALGRIAAALDIGLDSLVFVDDSPFERAEVVRVLPQVLCVPAEQAAVALQGPRFAGGASAEAGQRRRYYREAAARADALAAHAGDPQEFLRDCRLCLTISPWRPSDLERAVELAQRTNQLNFTGTRYDRAGFTALLADPAHRALMLHCRDRFGDYGTVGLVLARREGETLAIDEFMLSCRVQGRGIERALFAALLAGPLGEGARRLRIAFCRTQRNGPAAQVLGGLGFAAADDGRSLSLDASDWDTLSCDAVSVIDATMARA